MDNVSDIRNYMDVDQLAALAANDPDLQKGSMEELTNLGLEILKLLNSHSGWTSIKARACFEVLTNIVANENEDNFENAKEIALSWFETVEQEIDLKHSIIEKERR